MAPAFDIGDLGSFDLGGSFTDFEPSFNLGAGNLGLDLGGLGSDPGGQQWDWLKNIDWGDGGSKWNWSLPNISGNTMDWMKAAGWLGKEGFGAWQGVDRMNQMREYNDAYAKWVEAQNAYTKQKQAWEADFMNQFKGAQEGFAGANEEFQGQLGAATEQANMVLAEYMKAAKPLLAESQELLVPAVAALARGEVPEQWQPLLNDAKQKATAAAVQSMVSAGMSPDEARASVQPVVDQQAHQMLLALASSMSTQGLAVGQQGMAGLQGAGALTGILGQLAAAGIGPATQEFAAMANVLGRILGGGGTMVPPGKPSA